MRGMRLKSSVDVCVGWNYRRVVIAEDELYPFCDTNRSFLNMFEWHLTSSISGRVQTFHERTKKTAELFTMMCRWVGKCTSLVMKERS